MTKISTEYIKLEQLIKLENIAGSGGEAKQMVKTLQIAVNGEKENRRGRKLYPGDQIQIGKRHFIIEKRLLKISV